MDQTIIWQKTLDLIKTELSPHNYKAWFSPVKLESIDQFNCKLIVQSAFIKTQLISRYQTLILQSLKQVTNLDYHLEFLVDPSQFAKKSTQIIEEEDYFQLENAGPPPVQTGLNPKYTIENFVVGFTNNLAYAAAQAVVQNPGTTYNPLFIYGPSGVGKTHLMHAIGNRIIQKNPNTKLIYATSERFMNDFVDSIQNRTTTQFRKRYRDCSLLLIDDIQFIAGKDSTQEEFFHTYNELSTKNAQIILTSDRPPTEMQKLESRLLSRFQGGLMVDIQLPDFDTRVAILKAKLQERGETLPEEYLKLIAESIESNTRELEGKLISILQMLKLTQQEPTPEFIQQFIGKQQVKSVDLDHKRVLSTINQYFNLRMADLIGPRRQKEFVLPRQIAMYILYEDCHLPMERVGEILGGRDHTTILHGIEKIRQALVRDREINRLVSEVKQAAIN